MFKKQQNKYNSKTFKTNTLLPLLTNLARLLIKSKKEKIKRFEEYRYC